MKKRYNNLQKSLAIILKIVSISSLYYLPMQMENTLNNRKRERSFSIHTVWDFIEANIDSISVDYLEDHPEDWYKVNDGDLDCVYEWAKSDLGYYTEIMADIYLDNIVL